MSKANRATPKSCSTRPKPSTSSTFGELASKAPTWARSWRANQGVGRAPRRRPGQRRALLAQRPVRRPNPLLSRRYSARFGGLFVRQSPRCRSTWFNESRSTAASCRYGSALTRWAAPSPGHGSGLRQSRGRQLPDRLVRHPSRHRQRPLPPPAERFRRRRLGVLGHRQERLRRRRRHPRRQGRLSPARVPRFHDAYRAVGATVEAGVVEHAWASACCCAASSPTGTKELQHNVVMTVPYGEVNYGSKVVGSIARYEVDLPHDVSLDVVAAYSHRTVSFDDQSQWVYDWRGERIRARRVGGEIDSKPTDQRHWQHSLFGRRRRQMAAHPQARAQLVVVQPVRVAHGRRTSAGRPNRA